MVKTRVVGPEKVGEKVGCKGKKVKKKVPQGFQKVPVVFPKVPRKPVSPQKRFGGGFRGCCVWGPGGFRVFPVFGGVGFPSGSSVGFGFKV